MPSTPANHRRTTSWRHFFFSVFRYHDGASTPMTRTSVHLFHARVDAIPDIYEQEKSIRPTASPMPGTRIKDSSITSLMVCSTSARPLPPSYYSTRNFPYVSAMLGIRLMLVAPHIHFLGSVRFSAVFMYHSALDTVRPAGVHSRNYVFDNA